MKSELCALAFFAIVVPSALAQVSSVRSSIQSEAEIYLTNTTETDDQTTSDEQFVTIDPLGPVTSLVAINSAQGSFSASSSCSASFMGTEQFSFQANQQFEGTRGPGKIDAQSYGQTLHDEFQYDFTIPAEGQLDISGLLINGGISPVDFAVNIQVFAESMPGSGFAGAFFNQQVLDLQRDSEAFDFVVPLTQSSGSYRISIRLSHSGVGSLDVDPLSGSLSASFGITSESICEADLNDDGLLDFFDISGFLTAFGNNDPIADFNADGVYDFFDVSAFLSLYSAGC